jgi:hypothetical protein
MLLPRTQHQALNLLPRLRFLLHIHRGTASGYFYGSLGKKKAATVA